MKKSITIVALVIILTVFSSTFAFADVAKENVDIFGETTNASSSTKREDYIIKTEEILTILSTDKSVDVKMSVTLQKDSASDVADTADASPLVLLYLLFIVSALGMVALFSKKLKKSAVLVLAIILLSGIFSPAYAADFNNSKVNVVFSDDVLELFTFEYVSSTSGQVINTLDNGKIVGFQWNLGNATGTMELLYKLHVKNTIPNGYFDKTIKLSDSVFIFGTAQNNIVFPQASIRLSDNSEPWGPVNVPDILDGMREIKFDGTGMPVNITEAERQNASWYDYQDQGAFLTDGRGSRWANVMTEDDSMWVWIPRYAYRITYYTDATYTETTGLKTQFGKIEVVFLKNKSDNYKIGNVQYTAKRAGDTIAPGDYIVHPAFTDEESSNYANGGWDSELTGIWVAKFEAGFVPIGDPNLTESDLTYTATSAANNYYGAITAGTTPIKYPVFEPNAFSYNFINIGDSYALSKALNSNNNPYGLTSATADTHLMKNSEWGAVAYLAHSQYGRNGNEITINNVNAGGTNYLYGMTGIGGDAVSAAQVISATPSADNRYNGIKGMLASTTGNVYGIYDMSGGLYERTACYLNNGQANLSTYGSQLFGDGGNVNTKYKSLYSIGATDVNTLNYDAGLGRIGEAIWETSVSVGNNGSWFSDYSAYLRTNAPFLHRGGYYSLTTAAGGFAFSMGSGDSNSLNGFRPAICPVH